MAGYKTDESGALAPNDPYRKMEGAETRPELGLIVGAGGGDRSNLKVVKGGRAEGARRDLADSERGAAVSPLSVGDGGARRAKSAEQDQPYSPRFTGVGVAEGNRRGNLAKGGGGGGLGKKGPLAMIFAMIFGGAALFFSGQSLLGAHLATLFTKATDVQFTSYSLRNQRLFKFMMDGGDQIAVTPFSRKFTTFTPYMRSRLLKNGIEVGHLNASGGFESGDMLAGRARVLRYSGANGYEVITASDFQTKFATDVDFREAYYKAKRGRVAGFFDDVADRFYSKLGMSRNIFDDYKATGNPEADNQAFIDTVAGRVQGTDGELNTASRQTDDNGTPDDPSDDTTRLEAEGEGVRTVDVAGDTPQSKARTMVNGILGKVSTAGAPVCAVMRVANMVSVAAAANQIFQSANYFMGLMEPISKAMAGEGDTAAINAALNFLSKPTTSEVEYTDATGATVTKTVTGSALEAEGAKLVLGGIIPIEYEMGAYSLDNIRVAALGAVGLNGLTTAGCSGIQAASAIASLLATSIPGGSLAKFAIGMLKETVGGLVITTAVSGVVSAMVPMVAKMLFTGVLDAAMNGKPAGEELTRGAAVANFKVAQSGSAYMPASEERLKAQNRNTVVALAQEAKIDRNQRSPFDATSENTFLGSIVASFLPVMTNSAVSSMVALTNVVGSAVGRLLPTAGAADQGVSYTTYYRECKDLPGTMCDGYGYPIPATDDSTMDLEPDDVVKYDPVTGDEVTYEDVIMANMVDETTIRDNSNLAKFITFCAERESPWGVTDANILNALQTDYGVILNNLPFLNDVVDLVNAAEDAVNGPWATGANCKNSEDNYLWESEFKYYQRFIEDVRILAGMGAYEEGENPVSGYLDRYYEAHPLDNSFEGILARMTGYTRDDVAFLVEFVEYSGMLADYDPSERYAFGGSHFDTLSEDAPAIAVFLTGKTQRSYELSTAASPLSFVVYYDVRNRSFAV